AMTVVLVPVVHQFGAAGLFQVGLMAGVILVILAVSRVGRAARYLPVSLIEGFTAGIAVVIAVQQVPNLLGVAPGEEEHVVLGAVDAVLPILSAPRPGGRRNGGRAVAVLALVARLL